MIDREVHDMEYHEKGMEYHEKGLKESSEKLQSYRLERIECEKAIQQLEIDYAEETE
jgi:hypothetical protein